MNSRENQSQEERIDSDFNYRDFTLRNIFDRITDAFVAFDNQWNYIYLNAKAAEIIGRSPKDLIGKNIWKEFPEKKEDIFYASFFKAMSEQQTLMQEGYCHPLATWLHATLYPSSEGLSVYMQDITVRKKAEWELEESREKYRQIVETAQEGIWMIDENNRTVFVNQKMCDILEYSEDEMIGKENIFFLDDEGQQLSAVSLARRRKGVAENIEMQFITKSGKPIWANMSANPIYSKEGEYKGALAMISDITDKVKLQQQLITEQINKQKEIVKAVMLAQEKERNYLGQELHDNVNQILASTKLYLGIAGNENARVKELIAYPLELIDSAIEEIRSLCRRLVTPNKNVDLKALVQRVVDDFNHNSTITTGFSYSVINELPDDLKLNIYRIIQEQTNNILKYAEAKNVSISISEKDNFINIIVEDDGKGFDVSGKRTGIGISNMTNRVESYSGRIEIKSSEGNGCKIFISIPV
ncbi:MAG: PAS domain-containing sensor histidine kinase [Ginsengibacter sp.]